MRNKGQKTKIKRMIDYLHITGHKASSHPDRIDEDEKDRKAIVTCHKWPVYAINLIDLCGTIITPRSIISDKKKTLLFLI